MHRATDESNTDQNSCLTKHTCVTEHTAQQQSIWYSIYQYSLHYLSLRKSHQITGKDLLQAGCPSCHPMYSVKALKVLLTRYPPVTYTNVTHNNSLLNGPLPRSTRVSQYQKNIHSLTPCLCGYYTTSLFSYGPQHFPCISVGLTIFFYNLAASFLWPASRSYLHLPVYNACIFSPSNLCPFLKPAPAILTYVVYHCNYVIYSQFKLLIISFIPSYVTHMHAV